MRVDELVNQTIETNECALLAASVEKMRDELLVEGVPRSPQALTHILDNLMQVAIMSLQDGASPDWTASVLICEVADLLGITELPRVAYSY